MILVNAGLPTTPGLPPRCFCATLPRFFPQALRDKLSLNRFWVLDLSKPNACPARTTAPRPVMSGFSATCFANSIADWISRASNGFHMVFLWLSYGFPMVFQWFSHSFPMVFLWFAFGSPMVSRKKSTQVVISTGFRYGYNHLFS